MSTKGNPQNLKNLQQQVKREALKANSKLRQMYKRGYERFNYSMIRKYTPYLEENIGTASTAKGYFKTGFKGSNLQELSSRLHILQSFNENKFATVEYTKQHLKQLTEKWGLNEEETIDMFDLYREFGFDAYNESDELEFIPENYDIFVKLLFIIMVIM